MPELLAPEIYTGVEAALIIGILSG